MKKSILTRTASLIVAGIGLMALHSDAATNNLFTPTTNSWVLTPSTNNWNVDRYQPHSFGLSPVAGRLALQIGIDPAESLDNRPAAYQYPFYNTQGYSKSPGVSTNGDWVVEASLYIPSELTNNPTAPFRSDLWARTGPVGNEETANYYIIGVFAGDTNNRANPTPSTVTVTWEVWDGYVGEWLYLSTPITGGWNEIKVAKHGGLVDYYLNDILVSTDTNNAATPEAINQLSTVFIEAYNFGGTAYTASWSSEMLIDRSAPDSVDIVEVDGRRALQFTVDPSSFDESSAFYNTKGFQIPANVTTNNHWAAYGSVYVSANVANGTAVPVRTDLWARTGLSEPTADYFIIGIFGGDTNNRPDPTPATTNVVWEVWNDTIGWVLLPAPVTPGWHDLRISYDNGAVYYYIDKQLVYTQVDMENPAYASYLSTVFIETYNFGGPAYSSTWTDVGDTDASVPFLPPTLKIMTIMLTAQPGFEQELHAITNIPPAEAWIPIASNMNTTGILKYQVPQADLLKEKQFFRSALKP